jgi:gas vesicle protein
MSIFKPKKSKKTAIIATAVGGAVAAGAAMLYSTKKGKAMLKDASDSVSSLIGSAEKLQKTVKKEVKRPVKKAIGAARKTGKVVAKAKRG